MPANFYPCLTTTSTLASGDNTVIASAAGQQIRVFQVILAAAANADSVTLKFTQAGTASTAVVTMPVNGCIVLPYTGTPWALCDPGTAFVINSGTNWRRRFDAVGRRVPAPEGNGCCL